MITNYTKTNIAFSPNFIVGGRLSFFPMRKSHIQFIENLSIDLLPKYISKQYLNNTNDATKLIKPYFVTDLIVNCPLRIHENTMLTLKSGLYNLLNNCYEANGYTYSYLYGQQVISQNYFYPQSGIRWMIGIGIDL